MSSNRVSVTIAVAAVAICGAFAFSTQRTLKERDFELGLIRCDAREAAISPLRQGQSVFPFEGSTENIDGSLTIHYERVVHAGGTSQLEGRIYNLGSLPVMVGVTFFAYEPAEIFVGACPLHRVPFLFGYAREKLLAQKIPDDVATPWAKLASVTVEEKTLRLKMP